MRELKDTYALMVSKDYKSRFKAEYYQLDIRINKLKKAIDNYDKNTLDYKPECSKDLLEEQLIQMLGYKNLLKTRAKIEKINLDE